MTTNPRPIYSVGVLLPDIRTDEAYERFRPRDPAHLAAVREVCRRHELPARELRMYPTGSSIVCAVGAAHVVKFYAPLFADSFDTEIAFLHAVHGRVVVPTPAIVGTGVLENWRYVIMEQLRGESLSDAWPALSRHERSDMLRRVGEALAALHSLGADRFDLPASDWNVFIASQRAGCVARQKRLGLASPWLEQIDGFLRQVDLAATPLARHGALHTEMMRAHVLVSRDAGECEVSGIIDFEPSAIGAPEYDFASVGVFLACGESGMLSAFLDGYRMRAEDRSPALQLRMMAYALLHRYSKLSWYLDVMPGSNATTLEQLARDWFAFD